MIRSWNSLHRMTYRYSVVCSNSRTWKMRVPTVPSQSFAPIASNRNVWPVHQYFRVTGGGHEAAVSRQHCLRLLGRHIIPFVRHFEGRRTSGGTSRSFQARSDPSIPCVDRVPFPDMPRSATQPSPSYGDPVHCFVCSKRGLGYFRSPGLDLRFSTRSWWSFPSFTALVSACLFLILSILLILKFAPDMFHVAHISSRRLFVNSSCHSLFVEVAAWGWRTKYAWWVVTMANLTFSFSM